VTDRDFEEPQEAQPLPPRYQRLLREGDPAGDYPSRSEVIQAITVAAARAGWTVEELCAALLDPANVGGRKLQDKARRKGEDDAYAWLVHGWDKAVDIVRSKPTRISAEQATRWKTAAEGVINGPARNSDRLVFDALVDLAAKAGTLEVHASLRQLADLVGIAKDTARNALARLAGYGLLTPIEKPRKVADANTYRLEVSHLHALPDAEVDPPNSHPEIPDIGGSISDLRHDLWRNTSGLGKGIAFDLLLSLCHPDDPRNPCRGATSGHAYRQGTPQAPGSLRSRHLPLRRLIRRNRLRAVDHREGELREPQRERARRLGSHVAEGHLGRGDRIQLVLATVQRAGGFFASAIPAAGLFTIYLNKAATGGATVKVAYLVLD
jgi:hypothetical protein